MFKDAAAMLSCFHHPLPPSLLPAARPHTTVKRGNPPLLHIHIHLSLPNDTKTYTVKKKTTETKCSKYREHKNKIKQQLQRKR